MKNNTNTHQTQESQVQVAVRSLLAEDVKHSLLIVSLLANAFVLIGWVTLQVTTQYDYAIATFLFYR